MNFSGKAERHIVLRELIVFRHIGIKIALAVKFAPVRNPAGGHQSGGDSLADRLTVRIRQDPRMPHTDRADICIRFRPVMIRAFAKHFGSRFDLNVHFQANDSFISSHKIILLITLKVYNSIKTGPIQVWTGENAENSAFQFSRFPVPLPSTAPFHKIRKKFPGFFQVETYEQNADHPRFSPFSPLKRWKKTLLL